VRGGLPEHLPAEPRALARSVLKACTSANAGAWAEHADQNGWRRAARKRLVRAAGERAEQLESFRREQVQSQHQASLAAVAAAVAAREVAAEEERSADAGGTLVPLLHVQPEKAIGFDRNRTAQLTLRSQGVGHVAFRVRTSAPRYIFVQPCAGTLRQGEHIHLQVCSSERNLKAGDLKFLVQAVSAPDGGMMPKEKWAEIDASIIQEWHLVGRL